MKVCALMLFTCLLLACSSRSKQSGDATGGQGGSGNSGGAGAGTGTPTGSRCGANECATDQVCCSQAPSGAFDDDTTVFVCIPKAAPCDGYKIACTDSRNCSTGICCGELVGTPSPNDVNSAACRDPGACGQMAELCDPEKPSVCQSGSTCTGTMKNGANWFGFCE